MSLPITGDEPTLLRGFVQYFRDTLVRQSAGLDAAQLGQRLAPSTLTIGGLLAHMCFVEDYWFSMVLAGNEPDESLRGIDWKTTPDHDFDTFDQWTPEQLRARFLEFCARSDAQLDRALAATGGAGAGVDQLCAAQRHGQDVSLRWVLIHMVEEYARHCGHADLIRESIDGMRAL